MIVSWRTLAVIAAFTIVATAGALGTASGWTREMPKPPAPPRICSTAGELADCIRELYVWQAATDGYGQFRVRVACRPHATVKGQFRCVIRPGEGGCVGVWAIVLPATGMPWLDVPRPSEPTECLKALR